MPPAPENDESHQKLAVTGTRRPHPLFWQAIGRYKQDALRVCTVCTESAAVALLKSGSSSAAITGRGGGAKGRRGESDGRRALIGSMQSRTRRCTCAMAILSCWSAGLIILAIVVVIAAAYRIRAKLGRMALAYRPGY